MKAKPKKAPYRFCWWCSKQLYGNGSGGMFCMIKIKAGPVYVHYQCSEKTKEHLREFYGMR